MNSSPRYPQSNRKAENVVKTVKRLFKKCKESGTSEFQVLMDWRDTPSEGMSTSPAQRFFGCRCLTLLPMIGGLLEPKYPTSQDVQDINKQKAKQKAYYDHQVKPLKPLLSGSPVRVKLPGESKWTPAVCSGLVGPRRYQVDTDRGAFTRNRRQLLDAPEVEVEDISSDGIRAESSPEQTPETVPDTPDSTPTPISRTPSRPVRRSQQVRKALDWFGDYVPS